MSRNLPGDIEVLACLILELVNTLKVLIDVDIFVFAEVEPVVVSLRDDVQDFECVEGLFERVFLFFEGHVPVHGEGVVQVD